MQLGSIVSSEVLFEEKKLLKIFDYQAKWNDKSFESKITRFPSGMEDKPLLEKIKLTAIDFWKAF